MTATLAPPPLVSSRRQARALIDPLPLDLSAAAVRVDCADLRSAAPSFVDELIYAVLIERAAAELILVAPPERTRTIAARAAIVHGVSDRLTFA